MRGQRLHGTLVPVSLRCLIVDDNEAFLAAATTMLEREGVTVVGTSSTSADAMRSVDELRPDVVLVDVSLGEENGFDLARVLDDDHHAGGAHIVLISTRSRTELAELIERSPARGFIAKADLSGDAIRSLLERDPG
jgi:two-component system, NarL family, nitrate/nitrite response regulator NarL